MKKILALAAVVIGICLFKLEFASARQNGQSTTNVTSCPDIVSWYGGNQGGYNPEVAIDCSGNVIPTQTTAGQGLGTIALPWATANITVLKTTGLTTIAGPIVGTPAATGITGAISIAYPGTPALSLTAIAGSVTAGATPTISTSGVANGTLLSVINAGATGAITLQDATALTGSGLRLDSSTVVLQPSNDFAAGATGLHGVLLRMDTGSQNWIQIGQ